MEIKNKETDRQKAVTRGVRRGTVGIASDRLHLLGFDANNKKIVPT
jgi:hypothetical protein